MKILKFYKYETLVDDEDFDYLCHLNIQINKASSKTTTYATIIINRPTYKRIPLHRFIMGLNEWKTDKRVIDHIDGNGLNNQKSNLRIVSVLENSQSINRINEKNKLCLTIDKDRKKKYRICCYVNKTRIQKRFYTLQEALKFRCLVELKELYKRKKKINVNCNALRKIYESYKHYKLKDIKFRNTFYTRTHKKIINCMCGGSYFWRRRQQHYKSKIHMEFNKEIHYY